MDYVTRILIVDDDEGIRTLVSGFLTKHGYDVETAEDVAGMRRCLNKGRIDLIVLDVMMPGEDGLTALRTLGADAPPVIMLSAVGSDVDRIVGLEMGAEDYLAKPCNPRELLARIRAVLRRCDRIGAANENETSSAADRPREPSPRSSDGTCLRFDGWCVDLGMRMLFDPSGDPVVLTSGEFRLLCAFAEHPRRILTRDQLLDWSRGEDSDNFDRAIDVQLSRLRRKLAAVAGEGRDELIRTVRNEGYLFVPSVSRD
jgi:two-component system, OmpR family, response regulator